MVQADPGNGTTWSKVDYKFDFNIQMYNQDHIGLMHQDSSSVTFLLKLHFL